MIQGKQLNQQKLTSQKKILSFEHISTSKKGGISAGYTKDCSQEMPFDEFGELL